MGTEEGDYIETIADGREPSIERKLVAAQLADKVLAGLDHNDRIALTLVYCGDYTLSEVASFLGISVSNLKSRMFRCRNQIRERFGHIVK